MCKKLVILLVCCLFAVSAVMAAGSEPGDRESAQAAEAAEKAGGEDAADADDEEQSGAPIDEAWDELWSGQREMVNEVRDTARKLGEDFSRQSEILPAQLQPFENEARRLLVFANTFEGYPNSMEAVSRRISATISAMNHVLDPLNMARREAEGLLERINAMSRNLPGADERSRLSDEMKSYVEEITRARFRLTAVLAQFDSLLPSLGLLHRLEEKRKQINEHLPGLWKNFYFQKPLSWLSPSLWEQQPTLLYYAWQSMLLRLPVELPTTTPEWSNSVLRFCIGLVFAGALLIIARRRWLHRSSTAASRHLFSVSLPALAVGFALLGASLSAAGEYFRVFLAIGSLCMVLGEIWLAWDLRRLRLPDDSPIRPPFMMLTPLAVAAYFILYLPVTQLISLGLWGIVLTLAVIRHRHENLPPTGGLQFEAGALECYSIVLWLCLFLTMVGLYIYSMVVYLAYVSLSVALELCLGGMAIVNQINANLAREGARALLGHLLVALAAPFVLVLAVAGVCLWVAMLPGGAYLLGEYALRGVTVGATQFNVIQVLLIISVFYLTRAIVAMGTSFLRKLPQQDIQFDATLITPLSTALTYIAWALFGLFVLRALGMELSNLAMVAGGLSVGIGFGMQTIVNNFLSGLILIFSRTLQVGDVVEVGGTTGRVRKISIRATMVETYDNAVIYVPNSEFMSGRLINWTSFSRSVRREVVVGVAYGSDTEKVIKLLIEVAAAHKNVLQYPKPSVHFIDFGASTLDFQLRFWVKDYELGSATMSDVRLGINKVFNEEHIDIAFPQLDVHIKDEPKAEEPSPEAATAPAPEAESRKRPLPRRPLKKGAPRPPANAQPTVAPMQEQ